MTSRRSPVGNQPPDPNTWPSLFAWIARATWREWVKITVFVVIVIFAVYLAHRV